MFTSLGLPGHKCLSGGMNQTAESVWGGDRLEQKLWMRAWSLNKSRRSNNKWTSLTLNKSADQTKSEITNNRIKQCKITLAIAGHSLSFHPVLTAFQKWTVSRGVMDEGCKGCRGASKDWSPAHLFPHSQGSISPAAFGPATINHPVIKPLWITGWDTERKRTSLTYPPCVMWHKGVLS